MQPLDILILSNGPGEVATWVRPVVRALRRKLAGDRRRVRISVVLSPCHHAMGTEAEIARSYPEVDRVQSPEHFFSFLLWGKTAENWDWRGHGVVLFLGGDQFFPLVFARRLGYRSVVYAEWDARWARWTDHFVVMSEAVIKKLPQQYHHKCTVVGDLMEDIKSVAAPAPLSSPATAPLIALLPGSKPWKLDQGVPLCLAIAEEIHRQRPQTRFIIPVAPTLSLEALAKFGDRTFNPLIEQCGWSGGELRGAGGENPHLKTDRGLKVELIRQFPAYNILAQCHLAFTTVGANTAELASLSVPMVVLLPTQRLDAMRTWDGLPGLLANLPLVGPAVARLINLIVIQYKHLYAWPNIWAGEEIVPELLGKLQPSEVAKIALDWLENPQELEKIRARLRSVRGEPGAADKIAEVVLQVGTNSL